MTALPDKPGFYWWRETPQEEWRMVQLMDCGDGKLYAYDKQHSEFKGRAVWTWAECSDPIGEWQPVQMPGEDVAPLTPEAIVGDAEDVAFFNQFVPACGIEGEVCRDIAARQRLGIAKYGTTVKDNPLPTREWLRHAYQEALDLAIYLKRVMKRPDCHVVDAGGWRLIEPGEILREGDECAQAQEWNGGYTWMPVLPSMWGLPHESPKHICRRAILAKAGKEGDVT